MVIHDLNVICIASSPPKADPPLIVYTDTVLTLAIARKLFKTIRRRDPEVTEGPGSIQHQQFLERGPPNCAEPAGVTPLEDLFRLSAAETLDHGLIITRYGNIVKRYQAAERLP